MDRTDDNQVRGHRNHVIGFVGRGTLNKVDHQALTEVGRILHRLGRQVALVRAPGVAEAVREGVVLEGGETLDLETDVIGHSDHTFVIPDQRLLSRLTHNYPDLEQKPNVTIVFKVADLLDAMQTVEQEKANIAT